MFIFLGGDTSHLSPDAQQSHMQKWFDWVQKLEKKNGMFGGEAFDSRLANPFRVQKKVVTDGPYPRAKNSWWIFHRAGPRYERALEMAKECPDYTLNGIVEVREVVKFDNM